MRNGNWSTEIITDAQDKRKGVTLTWHWRYFDGEAVAIVGYALKSYVPDGWQYSAQGSYLVFTCQSGLSNEQIEMERARIEKHMDTIVDFARFLEAMFYQNRGDMFSIVTSPNRIIEWARQNDRSIRALETHRNNMLDVVGRLEARIAAIEDAHRPRPETRTTRRSVGGALRQSLGLLTRFLTKALTHRPRREDYDEEERW